MEGNLELLQYIKMLNFSRKIVVHAKKQGIMYYTWGEKQAIEIVSELVQMLDLSDRDFKAPTMNTFRNLKKIVFK